MQTRKILLIHNIAWSHYKAAIFSELYKICKRENFDIKVVHIAINEKGRKNLGEIDLSLHQYPFKILFERSYEETSVFQRIKAIFREIREYNPDVVVLPGYFDIAYWFALFYSKIKGKKVITGLDSTEYDHKRIWLKEQIKKLFIKNTDGAFCYGNASRDYVKKLGMNEDHIFIRCQATDNNTIETIYREFVAIRGDLKKKYNFNNYNFIYVGRLSREKNLKTLINAFYNLKAKEEKAKDWGLIIVGDGHQRDELQDLVNNLKLTDVYFVGGKSWKEVPEYYALADVFILPSISEPWGLVVNEAMICGLPVIVSKRTGAYFDLVKEKINGFGFDPYNQRELEDIMLKFVREDVDIKTMGDASKEIIKEYTPENAAMQMFRGIKKVLGVGR